MEHVLTDAIEIGWDHVVIVCNKYFALLIYNTTHKHNYHRDRTTPFGFYSSTLLRHIFTNQILFGIHYMVEQNFKMP